MGYQVLDVNKFIGKGPIPFEVYDRNGQPTGEIVNIDIGAMVNTGKLALKYIEKLSPAFKTYITKITWTIDYRCPTACTDGIRVFMNPIFAYQMICRCNDNIMDSYRKHKNSGPGWQKNFIKEYGVNGVFNSVKEITDFYRYRSVAFIILHEIYHQIYRHIQQAKRKPETRNADEATHNLANMAMDAEINRDIEWQFEELKGCTEEVPGITDGMYIPKYKKWAWNTIFDDYVLQGKQAAEKPIVPQAIQRGDPNQKQQQQQNGQGGNQPQDKPEDRTATESYAKGWNQAIADYKSGAVDPNTFKELPVDESKFGTVKPPKINQDEYNQGYNDAMNDMYNRLNGLNGNDGQGGKGANFSNLDENPIPQQGGGGQSNDDQSQNNQQNQQNQQNQSGQGQGGNQQQQNQNGQNQNGQQQNGGQQGQQNQNGQNGQQQGGQSGNQQNQQGQGGQGGSQGGQQDANSQQGGGGSQSGQQNGQNQNGQGQGGQNDPNGDSMDDGQGNGGNQEGAQMDDDGIPVDENGNYNGVPIPVQIDDMLQNDIIDKADAMEMAENADEPYDSDEFNDTPEEHAQKNNQKAMQKGLSKIKGMGEKLANIDGELNPPHIDTWDEILRDHLINAGSINKQRLKIKKPRLTQRWRADRAVPAQRYDVEGDGCADVFYLIDASGSVCGDQEYLRTVLSEIFALEERDEMCIGRSCLAYFSTYVKHDMVREWDAKEDSHEYKLDLCRYKDSGKNGEEGDPSGGTDILGCVNTVEEWDDYYRLDNPHTLLIVFTDGVDNLASADKLDDQQKSQIVFVILNDRASGERIKQELMGYNIPEDNIAVIPTEEYSKR